MTSLTTRFAVAGLMTAALQACAPYRPVQCPEVARPQSPVGGGAQGPQVGGRFAVIVRNDPACRK